MYDFYFGDKKKIENDPLKWLIAIKRMLPRHINSIPDSEYVALYNALRSEPIPDKPVLVETGCGASTLILLEYAIRFGGELYTWDISGDKIAIMRSIITDTLIKHFDEANLFKCWKYVSFNSNSDLAGIKMLKEMNKSVHACFFDSEHTSNVLLKEVKDTTDLMKNGGIIALDDANYSYKYQNTAYINMIRTKHGLPAVDDPIDNKTNPFWQEVESILKRKFAQVEKIDDTYKKDFQNDIFWSYYNADRNTMAELNMEKNNDLMHRFDAWKVNKKCQ